MVRIEEDRKNKANEIQKKEKQLADIKSRYQNLQDTANRQSQFKGDKETLEQELFQLLNDFK